MTSKRDRAVCTLESARHELFNLECQLANALIAKDCKGEFYTVENLKIVGAINCLRSLLFEEDKKPK